MTELRAIGYSVGNAAKFKAIFSTVSGLSTADRDSQYEIERELSDLSILKRENKVQTKQKKNGRKNRVRGNCVRKFTMVPRGTKETKID